MRRILVVGFFLVAATSLPRNVYAAPTLEASCRAAVVKSVTSLYQGTLKGTQKCFKTRIADGTATDCLDASIFDATGKLVTLTSALTTTMGGSGACGALGTQYAPSCSDAPPACAAACASCGTGSAVAACLACRVVDAAKAQVATLYGTPPDVTSNKKAQVCQNALGAETAKYGKARMKEQQKCQKDVDAGKLRIQCVSADRKGSIAKAKAKGLAKIVSKCLPQGVDQIPSLDPAATCLTGGTAGSAADCGATSAETATDAIFTLVSQPAFITGFVMTAGPGGGLIPLPGVRVEVVGSGIGQFTDRNGGYTLRGVPTGTQMVAFDGQRVGNYPRIAMGIPVGMVGETNMGIFAMPEIDMANAVDVGASTTMNPNGTRTFTAPVVLDNPTIPGATLDLPPGTVLTLDVPNRAPLLTVSMVPNNVMPFPSGVYSSQIFSFQPEGATISPPASATFPNPTALPDGSSLDLYLPDFSANTFILAGTGTVHGGGTLVTSDGPLISSFDWHFVGAPGGCLTDVQGRVVDGSTTPQAGATILVLGATTTTAADGTFTATGLPCAVVVATAAVTTPDGVLVGANAPTPPVFNGETNVGDIVVGPPRCGNGVPELDEECDDGGQVGGDGCSAVCTEESCGDAVVDAGEECDGTPGCTDQCTICGNGFVRTPGEECDLGIQNGVPGSGCSATCRIAICGNGLVEEGEECDDGSANGGNFCSAECHISALTADLAVTAVRAAVVCGDVGGDVPNDTWDGGGGTVPTCNPTRFSSTYQFGPNGQGSFAASFADSVAEAVLSASFQDVRTAANVPVSDAAGWTLRATIRVTLANQTDSGTLSDLTLSAPAVLADPGELTASLPVASTAGLDFASYTEHGIEIVDMALVDPDGSPFAVSGFLVNKAPGLLMNRPTTASGGLLGIVPAYVSCGNPGGNAPNGSVDGIPSCAPRETFTERSGFPGDGWQFASDTVLAVQAQADATDLKVLASGTGIRDNLGNPANGTGRLHLMVRLVFRDGADDETVIDFPAAWTVTVTAGKFALKTASINGFFASLPGALPPMPATQGAILSGRLTDPNGDPFATIGTGDIP